MARELIIHESTPDRDLFPPDRGRGLDLSNRAPGYVYGAVAQPFPQALIIPRSEWQARIQELEDTRTRTSDLCDLAGLKVKDQQQTEFCWINSPTHATEIVRVVQNEPMVSLSPASAGAQITGYRNEGGTGQQALEWIVSNGLVPTANWPDNAIDKQYATAANKQAALGYRVDQWWELDPQNLDQFISCLLMRWPVCAGYDWWSHEVTPVDPVWLDGTVAVRIDNSWGTSWGTNGRGILQGRRMLPDDAVVPRTAIAN